MVTSKYRNVLFWFVATILLLLSLKWILAGFQFLLFSQIPGEPRDLLCHWTEQQYVNRNLNPYLPDTPRLDLPEHKICVAHFPWLRSFLTGWLLYTADLPFVRYYYALIELVAIGVIIWWVWHTFHDSNRQVKIILSLSVTACSSIFTNLWVGQLAIILSGLLCLTLIFYNTWKPILPGLFLGFSLIKPTVTAFFLPAVVFHGGFGIAIVALVYVGIATMDVLIRTQTGLLEWMSLILQSGDKISSQGNSLLSLMLPIFKWLGLSKQESLLLVLAIVSCITLVLMIIYRKAPLTTLFAIAAVGGRFATYHRAYDNFMMIFLLVPLGYLAFKYSTKLLWFGFILVALSLWGSVKMSQNDLYQLFQLLAWMIGLAILLISQHKYIEIPTVDNTENIVNESLDSSG